MKKLFALVALLVLASLVLSACRDPRARSGGCAHPGARSCTDRGAGGTHQGPPSPLHRRRPSTSRRPTTPKKIAFFVSDLIERVPPGAGDRGEEVRQG